MQSCTDCGMKNFTSYMPRADNQLPKAAFWITSSSSNTSAIIYFCPTNAVLKNLCALTFIPFHLLPPILYKLKKKKKNPITYTYIAI